MVTVYRFFIADFPAKFYVGVTSNLKNRIKTNNSLCKVGRHFNCNVADAFLKSVKKELCFEVLFECEEADRYKKEYEAILSIGASNCYNILHSGTSFGDVLTYHPNKKQIVINIANAIKQRYENMSDEQKAIVSEKMKGSGNYNWRGGLVAIKETCKCGNKKVTMAKICAKCRDRTGANNPFFGKKHSPETLAKIRANTPYTQPSNSRPVFAKDAVYNSATDASKVLKCTVSTVLNRCNSEKFNDYYFIS